MKQWKGRSAATKFDPYKKLADGFVSMIEKGTSPWQRPWDANLANQMAGLPRNGVSGRPYSGGNAMLLQMVAWSNGDPRFMTKKQIAKEGYSLKTGATPYNIYFWKFVPKKKEAETTAEVPVADETPSVLPPVLDRDNFRPVMWIYTVFNARDIEGIPALTPMVAPPSGDFDLDKIEKALKLANGLSLAGGMRHGGSKAFYSPSDDMIVLPPKETFSSWEKYLGTLLHEVSHATGHTSRLNLFTENNVEFGSSAYAMEELRAEMTAVGLSQILGVPPTEENMKNHAAYLQSWLESIKEDPKSLYHVMRNSQKAVEFVLEHGGLENPWAFVSAEEKSAEAGVDVLAAEEDEAIPMMMD